MFLFPHLIAKFCEVENNTVTFSCFQIGNAWIDDYTSTLGAYDYLWTHALNSDEINEKIHKYCDSNVTNEDCIRAQRQGDAEYGNIDIYNIYAPICLNSRTKNVSTASVSSIQFPLKLH